MSNILSKAVKFINACESKKDFELYISCYTGKPQYSGGYLYTWNDMMGTLQRVYSVIYQGQSMMATQTDYAAALRMAKKLSKETGKEIGYWDGDKGKFVASLDDLTKK